MLIKVTAKMLDGRISAGIPYLPLDALIYVGYIKEHCPDLFGTMFEKPTDFDLPIKKVEIGDDWFYLCSFAMTKLIAEDSRFYNKRYDETLANTYLDGKTKVVETRKGKFKNARNALNIYLVNEISWVLDGDIEEVRKCLKHVNFIGKKKSQGFGNIKEWVIEETTEDLTYLRAIPNPDGKYSCGIRPPYFYVDNIKRVDIPDDDRLACVGVYR